MVEFNQKIADFDIDLPYEKRFTDFEKIYDEAMSPTEIYIVHDNVLLKKLNAQQSEQAQLECDLQMEMKHYNVLGGIAKYNMEDEYIIIMDILLYADYFQIKLEKEKKPIKNELKIKSYLIDILHGLIYLHEVKRVVHLDLKPANLFCFKNNEEGVKRVKMADFGLSKPLDTNGKVKLNEICGTFGFKAPEIKKGAEVNEKADLWSLGVIVYLMTVAYMPHHWKNYKYGVGELPFRDKDWKNKSPELQKFVIKLLNVNPDLRPSARDCLNDPFLANNDQIQQQDENSKI